jgi:hypothetical protein
MAKMGWITCLSRGIWARRPWNPLGKQAVWYDHDFEKVNERENYGIPCFDARCKRCGYTEKGWREMKIEPQQSPSPASRPSNSH